MSILSDLPAGSSRAHGGHWASLPCPLHRSRLSRLRRAQAPGTAPDRPRLRPCRQQNQGHHRLSGAAASGTQELYRQPGGGKSGEISPCAVKKFSTHGTKLAEERGRGCTHRGLPANQRVTFPNIAPS